ncbi:MAG TPA: hypothetical protein VKT82_24755 [Ktedonobacterales bacterium]|nr:hypothetical protein [Ktedonobacterales bacterium]
MRQHPKQRRWPTLLRNGLLGLLLGGLQVLVIGDVLSFWSWSWPWWLYIVVGALWYLLIPGWACFLTARQRGDANIGVRSGCLVGGIAIAMALIALGVADVLMTHSGCGIDCPGAAGCFGLPNFCPNINHLLGLLILFETMGGTIATVVGGSVGEAVGLRHVARRGQRRDSAEKRLE